METTLEFDKLKVLAQTGTGLSLRAACWVAQELFAQHTQYKEAGGRMASEHLAHNDGRPSAAAAQLFEKLSRYSRGQLERLADLVQHLSESGYRLAMAQLEKDRAREAVDLFLTNPQTHQEVEAEARAAVDSWWENEGKFEEELEDHGGAKYFHAENDRRRRFGRRELTAREYLKK